MKEYQDILILVETEGDSVHRVAYELLNKGREIADKYRENVYCLLLTSSECDVKELCQRGAHKVYVMKSESFANPEEQLFTNNIVAFIRDKKPRIVLTGATHLGRSLAPRIAAELGTGLTADCTDLKVDDEGMLRQIRPAFSDNILAHIKTITYPQMATVRYKEFSEASKDESASINVEIIPALKADQNNISVIGTYPLDDVNITDAEIVVAAGRGVRREEDLKILEDFATEIGGTLGVSRALVDAGMASSSIQIGYSGHRVKPTLYIACGISGAPQHLAGMKESETIVAINNDATAPIFDVADYGYIGDLYEIIPMLTDVIRRERARHEA